MVTVYGTGLSGPGARDTNWQVVAVPANWGLAPSTPYNAYVFSPGTAVGWYHAQPWDGIQGGYTNSDGHFYWIGAQLSNDSLIPFGQGANTWIVAQNFTLDTAGNYNISFTGLSDEQLSVFVNGSVSANGNTPTITGGTVLSSYTTNGVNFANPTTVTGQAYLHAGVNTIYAQVRDSGFSTGVLLSNFTFTSAPIPEPSTYALFGLGALGLVAAARRRRAA